MPTATLRWMCVLLVGCLPVGDVSGGLGPPRSPSTSLPIIPMRSGESRGGCRFLRSDRSNGKW